MTLLAPCQAHYRSSAFQIISAPAVTIAYYNLVFEGIVYVRPEWLLITLCFPGSCLKCLLDALVFKSAHFHVSFGLVCRDPLLLDLILVYGVNTINFVGNKYYRDLLAVVPRGLQEDLPPLVQIIIGFRIRNIENQDAPIAAPVEGGT